MRHLSVFIQTFKKFAYACQFQCGAKHTGEYFSALYAFVNISALNNAAFVIIIQQFFIAQSNIFKKLFFVFKAEINTSVAEFHFKFA